MVPEENSQGDTDGFSSGGTPTSTVRRWVVGSWVDTILAMTVYDLVDFRSDPEYTRFKIPFVILTLTVHCESLIYMYEYVIWVQISSNTFTDAKGAERNELISTLHHYLRVYSVLHLRICRQ